MGHVLACEEMVATGAPPLPPLSDSLCPAPVPLLSDSLSPAPVPLSDTDSPIPPPPPATCEPEPENTTPETEASTPKSSPSEPVEVPVGGLFTVVLVKENGDARLGLGVDIADASRMMVDRVS